MTKWKKVALLNGGWIAGIIISLFLVPSNTSFALWAMTAAVILAGLNYLSFGRQRSANGARKIGLRNTILGSLALALLLLELIFRYLRR